MDIVHDLCQYLYSEPVPKHLELTILPIEDDKISFLKEDIYIGIHFPRLPYLSRNFRTLYQSIKPKVVVAEYDQDLHDQLMNVLTCLLLVCPDHAPAWCDRRRLVLKTIDRDIDKSSHIQKGEILEKELAFLDLLFTQHSKA